MCGRVAQTLDVVDIAASKFISMPLHRQALDISKSTSVDYPSGGNFNLSPGMDCNVMLISENGEFQIDRKKWGLITKNGTAKKPLYFDESEIIKLCFESLCFNARSETLYSKPTFSKPALAGRTCIVAVDGYFEWKAHPIPKMNKTKQPYFVYPKQKLHDNSAKQHGKKEPLLIAGVWTSVATGIKDAPELESFAMLTTDASEQIKWLHHRMPVCIWDIDLAKQWLTQPSETLRKKIDDAARCNNTGFCWHKVTPEMSKLSFRSKEAIMEVKETTQSIRQFFASSKSLAKQTNASCSVRANENENEVEKKPCVEETFTTVRRELSRKGLRTSTTRDGKRQLALSRSYFSPTSKKGKLKRSPTPGSNKQISIDSFFENKKKKDKQKTVDE